MTRPRSCAPREPGPTPLPSFFVIGPPRTGTSWLHEVLGRRVQLPSVIKETRFFDVQYHRGWKWYRAHYPKTSVQRIAGEIAPTYFASAEARQRIAQLMPAPRAICILRDPVARIESLYRAKCAYGAIRGSLEGALLHDPELLESGRYATHLKAWQSAIGKDRVLSLIYDDLSPRPQALLDMLADFLGLERFLLAPTEIRRVCASAGMTFPRSVDRTRALIRLANWCRRRGLQRAVTLVRNSPLRGLCLGGGPPFPPTSASTRARLYEFFRSETEELEILLKRDLTPWKGWRQRCRASSEINVDPVLAG
jgi:hypothetical protein